jgi:N-acetylglucosamine malate deacetylase 2
MIEDSVADVERRVQSAAARLEVLIIAAHPDDETIGASTLMARGGGCHLIHVTDGAPREPRARPGAAAPRRDYARQRRYELLRAMSLVGVEPSASVCLEVANQEASLSLVPIARRLAAAFEIIRPDFVLTHGYEGGHPDHDAVAFAAWAATRLVSRRGGSPPVLYEMALYHATSGGLRVGEFLPRPGATVIEAPLSADELRLRRAMLDCFESQRAALAPFYAVRAERFRRAPDYDFSKAPHPGALWYERAALDMTGARWRRLATDAQAELRLVADATSGLD